MTYQDVQIGQFEDPYRAVRVTEAVYKALSRMTAAQALPGYSASGGLERGIEQNAAFEDLVDALRNPFAVLEQR
jgi:hypothetical protein